MGDFRVIQTSDAIEDVRQIFAYISEILHNKSAAQEQVNRIRQHIRSLKQMPERQPRVKSEPFASRGARKLVVDNYVVFYEVDLEQCIVSVVRIFYNRQNIAR